MIQAYHDCNLETGERIDACNAILQQGRLNGSNHCQHSRVGCPQKMISVEPELEHKMLNRLCSDGDASELLLGSGN